MSQMSNKVMWNLPLDLVLDEDSSPISGPYPTAQAEAGCSRFLHPASCLAAFHTAPTPTASRLWQ